MFLCAANRILGYISLYMRPLFAFFGLLLCVSSILADEQRVIKDSEAIWYVGKYVEVYGLVVSVTTSPLGTAFIKFRTRISQSDIRWIRSSRFGNYG